MKSLTVQSADRNFISGEAVAVIQSFAVMHVSKRVIEKEKSKVIQNDSSMF
jgi:hypothetical protein